MKKIIYDDVIVNLGSIDLEQLKRDKDIIVRHNYASNIELDGLIGLIDRIQDQIVERGYADEDEVFASTCWVVREEDTDNLIPWGITGFFTNDKAQAWLEHCENNPDYEEAYYYITYDEGEAQRILNIIEQSNEQ